MRSISSSQAAGNIFAVKAGRDSVRQTFCFAAAGVEHRFENFSDDLALLGCVLWARRRRIQWRMKNGTVSLDCSLLRCS
jgi:hypothetical protein